MRNPEYAVCQTVKAGAIKVCTGLLLVAVVVFVSETSYADNHRRRDGQEASQSSGISAGQAAAKAQQRFGGKVLKVSRDGNRYRVKLLLPSGTIKTVTIAAN